MLDIDGVLADFVLGITQRMSLIDPNIQPFPTSEQQSWDFRELPPGLFSAAFKEATKDAFNFNASLPPLITKEEGERLRNLCNNEEVYFATNRPGGLAAHRGTRVFLESAFGIDRPNIVITAKKGEFAAVIGATHAIDDKAGNVAFIKYHHPSTEVFLLDQPYNRFDQTVLATKVVRVKTFTQFLDSLK